MLILTVRKSLSPPFAPTHFTYFVFRISITMPIRPYEYVEEYGNNVENEILETTVCLHC